MLTMNKQQLLFAILALASLCQATLRGPCDPVVDEACFLPFPNDYWRNDRTGKLDFGLFTLPTDLVGRPMNPWRGGWNDLDGFSTHTSINTYLGDLATDNLPPFYNIEESVTAERPPIVLIDTSTGDRVPLFAELDHTSDDDFGGPNSTYPRMLMIWPATKLKHGTRYVVGIRDLKLKNGEPAVPSDNFLALRDHRFSWNWNINSRRSHFNSICRTLWREAGFRRSELQAAWDFTTNTQENIVGRLLHMRDDSFSRMPAGGPEYVIKSVEEPEDERVAKRLIVDVQVPYYTKRPIPGSRLKLDRNGRPKFRGWTSVEARIDIPTSVWAEGEKGAIMQYGHGLLGSYNEVNGGYLRDIAQLFKYVTVATDWTGMSEADIPAVALMFYTDLGNFGIIPDRTQQGVINALWVMKMMVTSIVDDPELMINGESVLDPSRAFYYGNSQGGILGAAYMAVSQDVTRGVLGVGGGPYAALLPRSSAWVIFQDAINLRYKDPLSRAILYAVFQQLWDRADPNGYVDAVMQNPFPNTPSHRVLLQYTLHDTQVNYIGVEMMARGIGAKIYESNAHEPGETTYGLERVPDTTVLTEGSLAQAWDFNQPRPPTIPIPPPGEDAHEGPRRQPESIQQMIEFFEYGSIRNYCGGVCFRDPSEL